MTETRTYRPITPETIEELAKAIAGPAPNEAEQYSSRQQAIQLLTEERKAVLEHEAGKAAVQRLQDELAGVRETLRQTTEALHTATDLLAAAAVPWEEPQPEPAPELDEGTTLSDGTWRIQDNGDRVDLYRGKGMANVNVVHINRTNDLFESVDIPVHLAQQVAAALARAAR